MGTRHVAQLSVVVAACLAAALTGCDASSSGDGATPSASAPSTSTSASASASPSPSVTAFATTCEQSLSLTAVSTAAGQPIIGRTAFVVGEPDASIGRLAYLNCRYGIPDTTPAPKPTTANPGYAVEIGVSLYDSADRAGTRVQGTVDDYRSSGSAATEVPVGARTGTVLVKAGEPATLVVADGARTVAVSVIGAVYTGRTQLAAIAAVALDKAV